MIWLNVDGRKLFLLRLPSRGIVADESHVPRDCRHKQHCEISECLAEVSSSRRVPPGARA